MHRRTLNWMGDRHKDPHREVHLDGIGGVSILVKASVHRSGWSHPGKDFPHVFTSDSKLIYPNCLGIGINFPCYAFENQADTEGFAAMANRAGYQVVGLPNYIVWHIDTEEKEGNLKGRPEVESHVSE